MASRRVDSVKGKNMERLKELPATKAAAHADADADIDIGRIVELAFDLGAPEDTQSVSDSPVGVGDACFSARKLLRLIQEGATDEDTSHLISCPTCSEVATGLSSVNLVSSRDFVRSALTATTAKPSLMEMSTRGEIRPLIVILGIQDRVLEVTQSNVPVVDLIFDLIPVFDPKLIGDLDRESLQLSGAAISSEAPTITVIDMNRDGVPDLLRIKFAGAKLSQRVCEGISHHKAVLDTVRVSGTVGPNHDQFVGQGVLEFLELKAKKAQERAISHKA
jgi:hypothetical protein